jgi:hypothetical protein
MSKIKMNMVKVVVEKNTIVNSFLFVRGIVATMTIGLVFCAEYFL